MTEQGWVVALVVLFAGLLSGFALSAITRRRDGAAGDDGGAAARLNELEARRAQLMEQLRLVGIDAAAPGERATLEREAAEVLRELDTLAGAPSSPAPAPAPAPGAAPAPASAPARAAAPAPARPGMSPQLVGALKGGLVVGIAFLLYTTLSNETAPRAPGMSITGNDAVAPMSTPAAATGAATGMGGGAASGMGGDQQAGSLAAQETPRLMAARERLAANPDSHEAKVALGWALVEAGGWIDVYHLADELVTANASDPDGLALAVAVRVAMGQREGLAPLVDQALMEYPDHAMLLAWRGRIAQITGDAGAKATFFSKALAAAADKADMQQLIAAFEASGVPTSRHPGPGAAPAPARPAEVAGDDGTAAFEGGVSGTVTLAAGVSPPPGAVLFLIARTPGGNGGPPTATRKIVSPTFPRAFTLGPADVMMGGPFPAAVTVQARLDSDGNPMTREATDLVAAWPDEVAPGQRGIVLELAPSR